MIVFLVWLWISNLAILIGAEFNAERARARNIAAGHPPDQEPYLPPRDRPKKARKQKQPRTDWTQR